MMFNVNLGNMAINAECDYPIFYITPTARVDFTQHTCQSCNTLNKVIWICLFFMNFGVSVNYTYQKTGRERGNV